jgi:quercetin dioxygenase-like cupin family protein
MVATAGLWWSEAMTDSSTPETVVLADAAEQLLADLPRHAAGRTARTVRPGHVVRAVVIALADGTEMAEHDSPRGATLQCLTGSVTMRSGDQEWPLEPGQLVAIPPTRHSVEAHGDSAILLTVALG